MQLGELVVEELFAQGQVGVRDSMVVILWKVGLSEDSKSS